MNGISALLNNTEIALVTLFTYITLNGVIKYRISMYLNKKMSSSELFLNLWKETVYLTGIVCVYWIVFILGIKFFILFIDYLRIKSLNQSVIRNSDKPNSKPNIFNSTPVTIIMRDAKRLALVSVISIVLMHPIVYIMTITLNKTTQTLSVQQYFKVMHFAIVIVMFIVYMLCCPDGIIKTQ